MSQLFAPSFSGICPACGKTLGFCNHGGVMVEPGFWLEHRPATSDEHGIEGRIHGYCRRCIREWPCQYSPEAKSTLTRDLAAAEDMCEVEHTAETERLRAAVWGQELLRINEIIAWVTDLTGPPMVSGDFPWPGTDAALDALIAHVAAVARRDALRELYRDVGYDVGNDARAYIVSKDALPPA